jgi:hypothetical protein
MSVLDNRRALRRDCGEAAFPNQFDDCPGLEGAEMLGWIEGRKAAIVRFHPKRIGEAQSSSNGTNEGMEASAKFTRELR